MDIGNICESGVAILLGIIAGLILWLILGALVSAIKSWWRKE